MSLVSICKLDPMESAAMQLFGEVESVTEQTKQKAFELFERRGRMIGRATDDWLTAERQLIFAPPSELVETDKSIEVRVVAPGFSAEQLKVTILPDTIFVEGKANEEGQRKDGTIHFCELSYRNLLRLFAMPSPIDPNHVYASVENGVLKIVASKVAKFTSTPLTVQAEEAEITSEASERLRFPARFSDRSIGPGLCLSTLVIRAAPNGHTRWGPGGGAGIGLGHRTLRKS
jgi:HSP20 family molecular chaperone IbpA